MNTILDINYSTISLDSIDESFSRFRMIQPRDESEMLRSIQKMGQLSPAVVGKSDFGSYVMIDGFKRLRSLRHLQRDTIKVRILEGDERFYMLAMIQLNQEGHSLRDVEEALIVVSLHRQEGLAQTEIAELLGHDKSWVSRRIGLVEKLSEDVFESLRKGLISPTQGREFLKLPRGNQKVALDCVLRNYLTSRETAQLINTLLTCDEIEHDSILCLPSEILNCRQKRRSPKKEIVTQSLDAALDRLEKCCEFVIRGIDSKLLSEPTRQINDVIKTLEETITRLKGLDLKEKLVPSSTC